MGRDVFAEQRAQGTITMDELAKKLEAESREQMLTALEALLAEATPGEWLNRGSGAISARTPHHAEGDGFTVQSELTPVAQTGAGDGWRGRAHGEHDADDHDAALVVYLHNAALERIRLARERLADREWINGRAAELEARLTALPDNAARSLLERAIRHLSPRSVAPMHNDAGDRVMANIRALLSSGTGGGT